MGMGLHKVLHLCMQSRSMEVKSLFLPSLSINEILIYYTDETISLHTSKFLTTCLNLSTTHQDCLQMM